MNDEIKLLERFQVEKLEERYEFKSWVNSVEAHVPIEGQTLTYTQQV